MDGAQRKAGAAVAFPANAKGEEPGAYAEARTGLRAFRANAGIEKQPNRYPRWVRVSPLKAEGVRACHRSL